MSETTTEPEIDAWDRVVDRLRLRERRYLDGDQVYILEDAFLDAASAALIERQQKAIDLLLKAIGPFAISEKGAWPDSVTLKFDPSPFTYGDLRAARSAKEQVVRILKGEEE